jgi:adenylosuccinate synthase
MPFLKVAVAYEGLSDVPAGADALAQVVPIYEEHPGWNEDISGCRRWEELPEACRQYVERLESLVGVPVRLLGVGAARDAVIER